MEPNAVLAGKSLTFVSRAAVVGKTRSSPGCGATSPTQLAGVVQRLFAPPPSQVTTAGARRSSRRVSRQGGSGRRSTDEYRRRRRRMISPNWLWLTDEDAAGERRVEREPLA